MYLTANKNEIPLMFVSDDSIRKFITPSRKNCYTDFHKVGETDTYHIFQAKSKFCDEIHMIRTLDVKDEKNYEYVAQLFIQELLHLASLHPQAVLAETFEIREKNIVVATRSCIPINLSKSHPPPMINHEKFIMNLTSEVEFLKVKMKMADCSKLLAAENIFFEEENGGYLIGNWAKPSVNAKRPSINQNGTQENTDMSDEIRMIGYLLLELNGVLKNDIEKLDGIENKNMYDGAIYGVISANFPQPEPIRQSLRWMLDKDPKKRPSSSDIISIISNKSGIQNPGKYEIERKLTLKMILHI